MRRITRDIAGSLICSQFRERSRNGYTRLSSGAAHVTIPTMKFGLRYASLGRYSNGPDAVQLAQAAEAAGFESMWTVEHVVVPRAYQSRYPYSPTGRMGSGLEDFPIPDPLIWLAYVASATRTLKLGTAILILPQRNPVVTAKAVATLDHLAGGGRVLLGIGVGWLAEEFATLGVPFDDRGPRTDRTARSIRSR